MKIQGQKINLRSLKKTDADSIYRNIKDRQILCFLANPPIPYKLKHAQVFILKTHRNLKSGTDYSLGIVNKENDQLMGVISLMEVNKLHRRAEIGYWLGKKYHRQGIMSEAIGLILDFAFKKLQLHSVWAGTFRQNIASQKLLKKYGFKYVGTMKKFFWRNARWNDDLMWQLLSENYKKVKK